LTFEPNVSLVRIDGGFEALSLDWDIGFDAREHIERGVTQGRAIYRAAVLSDSALVVFENHGAL
jgi:hypothetical protein